MKPIFFSWMRLAWGASVLVLTLWELCIPANANPPDFALNDRVRAVRVYSLSQRVEKCFPGFFADIFVNEPINRGATNKVSSQVAVPHFDRDRPSWLTVPSLFKITPQDSHSSGFDLTAAYDARNRVFVLSYSENELDVVAFLRDAAVPPATVPAFNAASIRTTDGTVTAVPPRPRPDVLGYGSTLKYRRACDMSEVVFASGALQADYIYEGPTLVAFRSVFLV